MQTVSLESGKRRAVGSSSSLSSRHLPFPLDLPFLPLDDNKATVDRGETQQQKQDRTLLFDLLWRRCCRCDVMTQVRASNAKQIGNNNAL